MKNDLVIKNPLTIQERKELRRLPGHDTQGILESLLGATVPGNIRELAFHLKSTQLTLIQLAFCDEIVVGPYIETDTNPYLSPKFGDLPRIIASVLGIPNIDSSIDPSVDEELLTFNPIVYSMIYNLAKNSLNAQISCGKKLQDTKINLTVESYSDFQLRPCISLTAQKDFSEFFAIRVKNSGREFPEDAPLGELLNLSSYHFGLPFVKLVAKLLKAPIDIHSGPEDTTVSFYHPVYR